MSLEEENALLLEVVAAMGDNEEGPPLPPYAGIAIAAAATGGGGGAGVAGGAGEAQEPLAVAVLESSGGGGKSSSKSASISAPASSSTSSSSSSSSSFLALNPSFSEGIVGEEMRIRPWLEHGNKPRIFESTALFGAGGTGGAGGGSAQKGIDAQSMRDIVSDLKERGFFFLRLSDEVQEIVSRSMDEAETFFNRPLEQKNSCHDALQRYFGYVNNEIFCKELFQMRLSNHGRFDSSWPAEQPELRAVAFETYKCLHELSSTISSALLGHLGASQEYIQSLFELDANDDSFRGDVSRSNLTMFKYADDNGNVRETVHCPHHSDISLLTIIPRCRGLSGLHLFDWKTNMWLDSERGCEPNVACVFLGETMAKLTNAAFIPGMHEVSNIGPGPRISMPFQFCCAKDALLDSSQLSSSTLASMGACESTSKERAGDFMERVSLSRVSSNFPRGNA